MKSNLCENDNDDHRRKGTLPKQYGLVKEMLLGLYLNKDNTVIIQIFQLYNGELQSDGQ